MPTVIYTHSACYGHDTGEYHPECPDRLRAVIRALETEEFAFLRWEQAPRAEIEWLLGAHPRPYVERILAAAPAEGLAMVDSDTIVSPGSAEAALRAAGAVCAAVDAVATGAARNAFCAVRPPGHHAEPTAAMGFCLFNNVAVGALRAREAHGIERVAIVDFDVHHGNGTQAIFERDPYVFYVSTHQHPLYPGTGSARERGVGNILNVPLLPRTGSDDLRTAFTEQVLPALRAFAPGMVMISAGFDGHRDDPLASLDFTTDDYHWMTARLCGLADEFCGGKVVSTLEGGYDLRALGESAAAHVRALMGS